MGKCLFMRKGETHTAPIAGLPSGYTELEYIESTGTQYIDTEFKPNNNTRIVIDFENSGNYSSMSASVAPLFGARDGASSAAFGMWIGDVSYPQYGNVAYNESGSFNTNINKRLIYKMNKNVVSIGTESLTCTSATFSANCSLIVLGLNNNGSVNSRRPSGKLYSCQIYDNGTLIRNFIPCINPSGEIGLYDAVNKKFYGNAGTGAFKHNLDFANYTWEEIIEACQTNNVPSFWNVGDSKSMTINGTDYVIDIIGKNHDTYSDGSGKAPLTFQMHDCYTATYSMNKSNTNSCGWTSCSMRTSMSSILALMPSEVQEGVKEVNKLTSAGSQSSTINTTADKLFLLSEIEIFGSVGASKSGEGSQYDYYKAGNSKVKGKSGTASNWWERSPHAGSNTHFCAVNSSGNTDFYQGSAHSFGVAFAFCF